MSADGAIGIEREAANVPRVSLWERFSFEAARVSLRFAVWLLPLGALYQFGRGFAVIEWMLQYKRRRRFAKRMDECFGAEMTGAKLRHASLRHFIRMRTDKLFYLIVDHLAHEELAKRFTIVHRALIDDVLATGRGVYLAMSHVGSHHVALVSFAELGYQVGGVRDPKEGASRRYIQRKRGSKGGHQVRYFHNDVFPRELFAWLKGPNLLISAMDPARLWDEKLKTVDVTMFGKTKRLLSGPLHLANRCGAPTLQAFVVSRPGFRYEFQVFGPLVDLKDEKLTDEVVQRALQAYADRIEQFIRTYPCHVSRI